MAVDNLKVANKQIALLRQRAQQSELRFDKELAEVAAARDSFRTDADDQAQEVRKLKAALNLLRDGVAASI